MHPLTLQRASVRGESGARESYICKAVTSDSARFGPNGIRQGARRLGIERINVPMKLRVSDYLDVVDCGDVRKSMRN